MVTDGTNVVRVIGVETFAGAQAIITEAGMPSWLSQGPNDITGGQTILPSLIPAQNNPVIGSINQIAVDPSNLSISAEVDNAVQYAVPAYRSGVAVDFKVKREGTSAIVIFKHPDGTFVEAGSNGHVNGSAAKFLVGYDGQAFIKDLAADNTALIILDRTQCRATFPFRAKAETQVVLGPVVCE